MEKDTSRRNFLSFVGGMTILLFSASIPSFTQKNKLGNNKEEYVFINGWLLKKEDFNDL